MNTKNFKVGQRYLYRDHASGCVAEITKIIDWSLVVVKITPYSGTRFDWSACNYARWWSVCFGKWTLLEGQEVPK